MVSDYVLTMHYWMLSTRQPAFANRICSVSMNIHTCILWIFTVFTVAVVIDRYYIMSEY